MATYSSGMQYLEEAEQLADRIAILHEGKIIARGTLSDLKKLVAPERAMALQVIYYGSEGAYHNEREFDLLVNSSTIAHQKLEAPHPEQLFDVLYNIPSELISGSDHTEEKFVSANGGMVGGVFGIRMVDRLKMEQREQKG